jgi:excisionase family DNA binding protein
MGKKAAIVMLKSIGLTNTEIADIINVSRQYISQILITSTLDHNLYKKKIGNSIISVSSASRLLGVHESTLRRWADKGLIDSFRLANRRKDRRFRLSDIRSFKKTVG